MSFNGRVTFSGDESKARQLLPLARQEFDRFKACMKAARKTAGKHRTTLTTDGAWCECRLFTNGMESIHVYAAPPKRNPIPDFYSGALYPGRFYTIKKGGVNEFGRKLVEDSVVAHRLFSDSKTCWPFINAGELKPASDVFSGRFAVAGEQKAGFIDTGVYSGGSQASVPVAREVVSSMYSGLMASVVQFLLGVGRISWLTHDDESSPGKKRSVLDSGVVGAGASKLFNRLTDQKNAQIMYQWGASNTHGVVRASNGRPVLVEVSSAGVRACLLPIDPQTDISTSLYGENPTPFDDINHPVLNYCRLKIADADTPEQHSYYKALLDVIEMFGGLPTGELPTDNRIVKKGGSEAEVSNWCVLLEEQGMKKWGETAAYSTAMGWAFNPVVAEARNTGWQERGVRALAGYDFHVTMSIEVDTDPDNYSGVVGAASMFWRSAYIPSLPQVKFAEPAMNGLLSMPRRPLGPMKLDAESQPGPVYLHVYYDDTGALKGLLYNPVGTEPRDIQDDTGGACSMSRRTINETAYAARSAFSFDGFSTSEGGGTSSIRTVTKPVGVGLKKIGIVDDYNPANDVTQNATIIAIKRAVWETTTTTKNAVESREAYVIPLYDRCALFKLDFKFHGLKKEEKTYGYIDARVPGKRPWFHRPSINAWSDPIHIIALNYSYNGCNWVRPDKWTWFSGWKNVGDPADFKGSDWSDLGSQVAKTCESVFGTYDIDYGKCNGPDDLDTLVRTYPGPSIPQPTVKASSQWEMSLYFANRRVQSELVYTKTGDPPAGWQSNPEVWYEVYGNWFTRSPDPDYPDSYDTMEASCSCLGNGANFHRAEDINRADGKTTSTFGLPDINGVAPSFVGVLNAPGVE